MNNHEEKKKSFAIQVNKSASYHMFRKEYSDYLIRKVGAHGTETVLEVAAGTCICGRALAPYVKTITCLDLTEEMLAKGREAAVEEKVTNIQFRIGNAEELPYPDESFDLVITRLSLHHFTNPAQPVEEMKRVLKKGGKLVTWDMEAPEEPVRVLFDNIERMRDPSHNRVLSRAEIASMFGDEFDIVCEEMMLIPVDLQNWMNLTDTPAATQDIIRGLMRDDLAGNIQTGFCPYIEKGEIMFDHRWLMVIGIRK